ncbi:MAG: HAMP domain-containing protein [Myxococcota bacterium]|nr:HAMP domain-containing protein [Myxococcota bacterium]
MASPQRKKSLLAKLTQTTMGSLTIASLLMLGIALKIQSDSANANLSIVEKNIRNRILEKGKVIVENQSMGLKGLIKDNAYADIKEVVTRTVLEDQDIVYGVVLDANLNALAIEHIPGGAHEKITQKTMVNNLGITKEIIASEINGQPTRNWAVGSDEVFEFVAHIFNEDKKDVGSIRYGLSKAPIERELQAARLAAEDSKTKSIIGLVGVAMIAIFVGFLNTHRQFTRITKRLGALSQAADDFSSGDNEVQVKVGSGDEIENLEKTFNKMVTTRAASYANLHKKNADLTSSHHALTMLNQVLQQRLDKQTAKLNEKNYDIKSLRQNMKAGFFTVLPGMVVDSQYSRSLEAILEHQAIAGRSVKDLLFKNTDLEANVEHEALVALAASLDQLKVNMEHSAHLFPRELQKTMPNGNKKVLEVDWNLISYDNLNCEKIMVTLHDVTELRALQKATNEQARKLEIIGQILAVPLEDFQLFMQTSHAFFERNRQLLEKSTSKEHEIIIEIVRNMYTVKSNAQNHGLSTFNDLVDESEASLVNLRDNPKAPWDPQMLLNRLEKVEVAIQEYEKIYQDQLSTLSSGNAEKRAIDEAMVKQLNQIAELAINGTKTSLHIGQKLHKITKQLTSIKLEDVLKTPIQSIEAVAEELAKPIPNVVMNSPSLLVPQTISPLLQNVFNHVFRNSMNHGLETIKERIESGKCVEGTIVVDTEETEKKLIFTIYDDGRGLNMDMLRIKAKDLGVSKKIENDIDLANIIFESGVSTALTVTDISGRGVGMNAVKSFIEQNDGSAQIHLMNAARNASFRPFKFVFEVPIENQKTA